MDINLIIKECTFKAIRASGSGGQHVNKVASKIELQFDLMKSNGLSSRERAKLITKLKNRLNSKFILILHCQKSRSQHKNKELVLRRFERLLKKVLGGKKPRIPTKTPLAVIKKRREDKRRQSERKLNRKRPKLD